MRKEEINPKVIDCWPNCQTPDCDNKCCVSRNSIYCSPCTDRLNADDSAPPGYLEEYRHALLLEKWKGEGHGSN